MIFSLSMNRMASMPEMLKPMDKTVVSLATFVELQVWYGIPHERVPKSPLNSG